MAERFHDEAESEGIQCADKIWRLDRTTHACLDRFTRDISERKGGKTGTRICPSRQLLPNGFDENFRLSRTRTSPHDRDASR